MATMATMTTKTFWFQITNDYRSGPSIYTYPDSSDSTNESNDMNNDINNDMNNDMNDNNYDEENEIPMEACYVSFEVPEEGKNRLYIVNEFPKYQQIWHKDIGKDENYKNIYLKIFSQIHNCMPFRVTGINIAYKEEGEYPDIPNEIKDMANVLNQKELKSIENDIDGYYFFFVIDSDGNEVSTNLLIPIC